MDCTEQGHTVLQEFKKNPNNSVALSVLWENGTTKIVKQDLQLLQDPKGCYTFEFWITCLSTAE